MTVSTATSAPRFANAADPAPSATAATSVRVPITVQASWSWQGRPALRWEVPVTRAAANRHMLSLLHDSPAVRGCWVSERNRFAGLRARYATKRVRKPDKQLSEGESTQLQRLA